MVVAEKKIRRKRILDVDVDPSLDLFSEIEKLKRENNAVVLAHYYQEGDIQDVADYIGDEPRIWLNTPKRRMLILSFSPVSALWRKRPRY